MQVPLTEKLGGVSIVIGAVLFAVYSSLFTVLLPIGHGSFDYVQVVLNPNWTRLAFIALIGILLMLVGFYAVYARLRRKGGLIAAIGFLFIEAAYLLQACKVTWELFLYPVIASHPESAFLLRDAIIKHAPAVVMFRTISSITIFIGIVLFCFALYRSTEYPKSAALLIFVGALVYALGPMLSLYAAIAGIFTLAIGCALLGVRLFKVQSA
jgi:hypothetical protein